VHLDALGVKLKAILGTQKGLHILALVTLELDYITHLSIGDDSAIASKLLLDHLENLLLVEFLRQTLNSGQSFTSITLLNTYMDVILRLLGFTGVFVRVGEGVWKEVSVSKEFPICRMPVGENGICRLERG
jgi:hypothetical protein